MSTHRICSVLRFLVKNNKIIPHYHGGKNFIRVFFFLNISFILLSHVVMQIATSLTENLAWAFSVTFWMGF